MMITVVLAAVLIFIIGGIAYWYTQDWESAAGVSLIILVVVAITTCSNTKYDAKRTYIETNRGVISGGGYYCKFGALMDYDSGNVYDGNGALVRCLDIHYLTNAEWVEFINPTERTK